MRGVSQIELATLILLTAAYYPEVEANSELIGEAAGCSPVIVRRMYKHLKDAELLDTKPGRYGIHLARKASDITLLEITEAVRPLTPDALFGVDAPLPGTTPIAESLFVGLSKSYDDAIGVMRAHLESVTLEDISHEIYTDKNAPKDEQRKALRSYLAEAGKRYGTRS